MESDDRPRGGGELSPRRRIDAACDRFEVAWCAGESPRIEEFLAGWPQPDRMYLFWELLAVELELRLGAGEDPTPDDYRARFPEHADGTNVALRGCCIDSLRVCPRRYGTSHEPFLQHLEGLLEPTDLTRFVAHRETRERFQDLEQPPYHPAQGKAMLTADDTTEWMPKIPDSDTPTATDLTDAPEELTEQMPGSTEQHPDQKATTNSVPETVLQSDMTGPPASTDPAISDPGLTDAGEATEPNDPVLDSTRVRVGMVPAVGTSIPGYVLLEKLGEGGMGIVYKARHLGLNRLVALKMIRSGGWTAGAFARFPIEAEAVARLRHPNIIQVYDIGEVDHLPFVTLSSSREAAWRIAWRTRPAGTTLGRVARHLGPRHPCRAPGRDRPSRPQAEQCPVH